jgi:hypothetical protein
VLERAEAPVSVGNPRARIGGSCLQWALSVDPEQPAAWSAELARRLERHPRALWSEQASPTVRFWLEVHDGFKRECVALTMTGDDYREGRIAARQLAVVAGQRLRGMVGHLLGHHEIEDYHYFPTLREAEPRLARGFDLLASDHAQLHAGIDAALAALADLTSADASGAGAAALRHAADIYRRDSDALSRRLVRHLSDEEDLIIPLLLDRGA